MKKIYNLILIVTVLIGISEASANITDPVIFMKEIAENLFDELRKTKRPISTNETYNIIETFVVPNVDFIEMSVWIAGKHAWYSSPAKEQEEFINEFKVLVINTYSSFIKRYINERVIFYPYKGSLNHRIKISSVIKGKNTEVINIDYLLIMHGNTWKIYDVIIEGISVLKGFQAQFANEIKHAGLAAVTGKISQHNKKTNV